MRVLDWLLNEKTVQWEQLWMVEMYWLLKWKYQYWTGLFVTEYQYWTGLFVAEH
ncbi:hypothetical protein GYH30_026829 [Glycine max]|nr:hypothetical protein GYH30_026829 [Glycine max]